MSLPKPPKPPPRPDTRRTTRGRLDDTRRSRPIDMPLDERRAEFLRAYVKNEPLPSDPPPHSDPPQESDPPPEDVDTSAPRIVEVPPDMTIRPRRNLHQKVTDAQKTVIAIGALVAGIAAAFRPLYGVGESAYKWYDNVNQAVLSAKAVESAMKESSKLDREAIEKLRADHADAGALQGQNWDQQDEINQHVYKELTRAHPQTPPPSLGPKAKATGRH